MNIELYVREKGVFYCKEKKIYQEAIENYR